MDSIIYIVAVILVAAYGLTGVWLVARQRRISHTLLACVLCLLAGRLVCPYLYTIATVIGRIVAAALVLCILGLIFG